MSTLPLPPCPLVADLHRQNARAEELIVSNPRQALATARIAYETAREHQVIETQPASLWAQGIALGLLEQMDRSDALLQEAVKLAEQLDQRDIQFRAINGLGGNAHRRGEYGKAFSHYHTYLSHARRVGDPAAQARALGNIGLLFQEMGEIARSMEIAEQVLVIACSVENPLLCALCAANIAEAHIALGQFEASLEVVERWRPVAQKEGFHIQDALMLAARGAAKLGLGNPEEALTDLEAAVALGRQVGDFHEICGPLVSLGEAYQAVGRTADAFKALNEVAERCGRADSLALKARASRVLMSLHEAEGRYEEALRLAHTVLRLQEHVHGERLSRRTEVLAVEFEIDQLRNQAELERQKTEVLRESNALLHRLQESLQHEATHDSLTGLYNRRYFLQLLETTLADCRQRAARFGIAYLDLDGFKLVNDTHGHPAGDALLTEIARRVLLAFRSDDVVARLGGDEFAIILTEASCAAVAEGGAERLAAALGAPFLWDKVELQCAVSIGVATFPEAGDSATDLLHAADAAMYLCKRRRQEQGLSGGRGA